MNDILRIARLRIALQRAFLGQAILRVIPKTNPTSSSRKRVESKFQGSPELDEWMDGVVLLTKCCRLVGRGA